MADYASLAAAHRAAVKTAVSAGQAHTLARHRYQAAATFGVPSCRLAELQTDADRAAALLADANQDAAQANAAASAANPTAGCSR